MQFDNRLTAKPFLDAMDVYCFAYGSNMRSSVMEKRNIRPQKILPAFLPEYYLSFAVFGVPYSGPSMASISRFVRSCSQYPDDGGSCYGKVVPDVHGSAYLISSEEYRSIITSEVSGISYDELVLEAFKP